MIGYKVLTEPLPKRYSLFHKKLMAKGILGEVILQDSFPDTPQFYIYACERAPGKTKKRKFGFGCSQNKSEAFVISIAEAIEYYCITHEPQHLLVRDAYKNLKDAAINPQKFRRFTDKQLKLRKYWKFKVHDDTPLNWIEGVSLSTKTKILIPAQLVFANYDEIKYQEPVLEIRNSTGSACGPTEDFAIYKGLCELIERDTHMINFINGLTRNRIDFDDDSYLKLVEKVKLHQLIPRLRSGWFEGMVSVVEPKLVASSEIPEVHPACREVNASSTSAAPKAIA